MSTAALCMQKTLDSDFRPKIDTAQLPEKSASTYTSTHKRYPHYNKTENVRVNVTLRRVSETTVEVEKLYVLHVFFVALDVQHAKRMRLIILSSVCTIFLHIIS